jgi:O-antigen ligase
MRALEWGLLAALVASVLALGGTPALAWSSVGVAVSALFLTALWRGALQDATVRRFLLWPAAFLVYTAVAITYSAVPARSVFYLSQWGVYFAGAFVAFVCMRSGGGALLRRGLVCLAAIESMYGLFQYLAGYHKIFWYQKTKYLEEATGTYLNHNHFAGLLTMALPPALAFGVPRLLGKKSSGLIYCGTAGLLLLGIVFSKSRMGIAAAFIALVCFGIYLARKTRRRIVLAWVVLLPIVTLAYGVWIGLGPVERRFADVARPGYLNTEGRLTIWKDTWTLVRQRPWFGWGPGTFPAVYPLARTEPSDLRWMEAHNDYLQFLCELGIVGFVLFFAPLFVLIALLMKKAWRQPYLDGRWEAALAASLIAVLAHCSMEFHLYVPANALLIMVLAGMGSGACSRGWPARSRAAHALSSQHSF